MVTFLTALSRCLIPAQTTGSFMPIKKCFVRHNVHRQQICRTNQHLLMTIATQLRNFRFCLLTVNCYPRTCNFLGKNGVSVGRQTRATFFEGGGRGWVSTVNITVNHDHYISMKNLVRFSSELEERIKHNERNENKSQPTLHPTAVLCREQL